MGIYKSAAGYGEILSLYDQAQARIGLPFADRYIPTRFGDTHVLVTGPAEAPPLVIFHGGNIVGPATLGWFRPLLERFRVYAPDTIGHPGKSAQVRVSPRDDSYPRWVVDLLDGLGLDRPFLLGHSYGGGIILATAAVAPERIGKAVVLMPAGLALGPVWPMVVDVLVPTLRYMWRPSAGPLRQLVGCMSTGKPDLFLMEVVGAVFRHVRLERGFPRVGELGGFGAPTLAFAGERDPFFPADALVPELVRRVPGVEAVRLAGCSHFPSAAMLGEINRRVLGFLQG